MVGLRGCEDAVAGERESANDQQAHHPDHDSHENGAALVSVSILITALDCRLPLLKIATDTPTVNVALKPAANNQAPKR